MVVSTPLLAAPYFFSHSCLPNSSWLLLLQAGFYSVSEVVTATKLHLLFDDTMLLRDTSGAFSFKNFWTIS